ncbi:4a-hydroxytetrahydrobiopterin dehydratase [Tabrizicola oligotrophica]|nr:4a-hydroxytetrahydrobiopterin dehydratase [Tabrizicola oligotrophica]
MTVCDLTNRDCAPCRGEGEVLADPAARLSALHPDWRLDGQRLTRRFGFKGFARAVQMANLAAWLGEKLGHHPDVGFGWGWCEVTFTSHELGGLSDNDFIAAARLDAITG